jgi:hypothetical protein
MKMVQKSQGSIFIDSGAHSLWNTHVKPSINRADYSFYKTNAFWEYVDNYAAWIKERKHKVDTYVNVDVIFNPEMTWEVQKYLEDTHKLEPLPVVHYGTPIKWLKRYMGYKEYIGIGGLGQGCTMKDYHIFADEMFNAICDSNGMPKHRIHGFAVTSPALLHKYPWWSVDSTSWVQFGRFGAICIPKMRGCKLLYKQAPIVLFLTKRSPKINERNKHIETLSEIERKTIEKFIAKKGYKLGKSELKKEPISYELKDNEIIIKKCNGYNIIEIIIEKGLINNGIQRDTFNAKYFVDLANSIPKWPWKFRNKGLLLT